MSKKEKKEKNTTETKSRSSSSKNTILILVCNIAVILVGALLVYFYFSYMIIVIFVVVLLLMDYYFYSQRINKKKREQEQREEEFISLITYFKIYLTNGINVYQSLQLASSFLSEWMKEQVDQLLQEIDNDKTINPYLNFASLFSLHHYEDVMTAIYQLVDQGGDPAYMNKFVYTFEKIEEEDNKYRHDKDERGMNIVSALPIVGCCLFTICLTFGIISMLGDFMDVL
ncbi:MAG: hypothetical protein LUD22_00685 [Coprobacillus sp.]|nr:hypothetical protein [Coprobacillus sp.]